MGTVTQDVMSQKLNSDGASSTASLTYALNGYSDGASALDALKQNAPTSYTVDGIFLGARPAYSVDPVQIAEGSGLWKGTVSYKNAAQEDEQPESPEDITAFSFDFNSLEDVRFEAISQKSYTRSGPDPTTNYLSLNQTHEHLEPEGVPVNKPVATFSATVLVSAATATNEWFKDRMDQVWTLNDAEFRSLPKGSVAFTGMTGNQKTDGSWEMTFNFEYRPAKPEETFQTKSGTITVPATEGWQYVWLKYKTVKIENEDSDDPAVTQITPQRVYVADVYETSDFSKIPIIQAGV